MQRLLEEPIGDLLRERGWSLSVAESCTGGLVSDRITNVPGSSDYFEGGIVSYSLRAKARHLGIPLKYIERHGAVSPQVAKRMAEGVRRVFKTTYGLSITGVAGPTGGTRETPVGTVFIGFSDGDKSLAIKKRFKGNRREIKEETAEGALRFLYEQFVHTTTLSSWIDEISRSRESIVAVLFRARQGISHSTRRVGVFPASFNPPTMAHLALIREAKKQGDLDEILVLLDIQAMDKRPTGARFEDRLIMVRKTFERDPRVAIGVSSHGLFVQKLKPLRALYPAPVTFIVGFDTILRVMDKRYYRNRKGSLDQLFDQSQFLVANREGVEERAFEIFFRRRENKRYMDKVSFFTLPKKFSSLSSSLIREKIAKGEAIDGLVPASVLWFIKKQGLYRSL